MRPVGLNTPSDVGNFSFVSLLMFVLSTMGIHGTVRLRDYQNVLHNPAKLLIPLVRNRVVQQLPGYSRNFDGRLLLCEFLAAHDTRNSLPALLQARRRHLPGLM